MLAKEKRLTVPPLTVIPLVDPLASSMSISTNYNYARYYKLKVVILMSCDRFIGTMPPKVSSLAAKMGLCAPGKGD
jgi:hypothetical protein